MEQKLKNKRCQNNNNEYFTEEYSEIDPLFSFINA